MSHRLGTSLAASALAAALATLALAPFGTPAHASYPASSAAPRATSGPPQNLRTTVAPGAPAIEVTWDPPTTGLPLVLGYEILLDGEVVGTVSLFTTSFTIDKGLTLGHTYEIAVRGTLGVATGQEAYAEQTLYIAPVTTVQKANPSNPLAGREWGVYTGLQDPAYIGWNKLGQAQQEDLALFAMIAKATWFGHWIPDDRAGEKVRAYVENAQGGDPDKVVTVSLFRMFPWEGQERIADRLPTPAEQASYRRFVTSFAAGIGSSRVAVIVQPDGYFVKDGFEGHVHQDGRHQALLPARMLSWTVKTLSALPNTTAYLDMGSEDWARGDVASVAKYLRLSGVQYARGFSMNVTHANYMDREIDFAQKVSDALARRGIAGKHAILDTSDNGHPFHGSEINPPGAAHYTPPGAIPPCKTKTQKTPCDALGIPPTTDVDNPAWGLDPVSARTAAKYVDAYVWASRPWLPLQGTGGTPFNVEYAQLLKKTWAYSPYFVGTP